MNHIDISLPITEDMVIYPGTNPTSLTSVKSASGSSTLSEISMTSHAGTHIDAPSHVLNSGVGIDELDLSIFYGPCRVLDMTNSFEAVTRQDLEQADVQKGDRILLKTANSTRGFAVFDEKYIYLDPEGAKYLAKKEVILVGIDALSVKQRGETDNTAHTALLSKNVPIVEGLDLSKAQPGGYILCALPLAFKGIDGSPTRAILLPSR